MVKCGGNHDSKGSAGVGSGFGCGGKALIAMYYGEDLYDDVDEDDDDRIENALTHFLLGAFEVAAWLVGAAVVGAFVGTDLESSPWFWVVLIALPLIVGLALLLRRTRKHERLTFDLPERS
jgi:F0F1-type ATP synthase assembly protein I